MRRGRQLPTWERIGSWHHTRGPEAVSVFESYGRRYYDSQRHEMDVLMARDERDDFAGRTICITKPRQNGKSFAVRDYALWMALVEKKNVLYSAHHGRTVRKMFKEMCDFIESNADFANEVVEIYRAGGQEGIYFEHGSIEFQTRTSSNSRGGTYHIVIIDEAQQLTEDEQENIIPAVSAASELGEGSSGPQKIYIGTVPGPGCPGTVFQGMHDRVHDGESSIWWLEWAVYGDSPSDIDVHDVDLWYEANPAMGRRISEATIQDELETMSLEGFLRERLGWWGKIRASGIIAQSKWSRCATDDPPQDGVICFAVKYGADGLTVAVCAAIKPYEEPCYPHIELVYHESMEIGQKWLEDFLYGVRNQAALVIIDGRGFADDMKSRLESRGFNRRRLMIPTPAEMAAANSKFVSLVRDGEMTYYQDDDLDHAALECTKRKIGTSGGFGFMSTETADAAVVEAAALATFATSRAYRDPNRKARCAW